MIEIRIAENQPWEKIEIQYRFVLFTADASGALCPPDEDNMWSEWKTAPYVKLWTPEEPSQESIQSGL